MKCVNYFLVLMFLSIASFGQSKVNIIIQNNSSLDFKEAVVAVKWENILVKNPLINTTDFVVIDDKTHKQIPFQLEYKGLKTIQNLLLQVDVMANSSASVTVQTGKPENKVVKTYGRYVPERKDDFAWENDRIAFRAYGKALEKTKDNAYGLDVWVKRTNKMIINERYKRGNYHVDHGDGLDYYHVGPTLGAGNMALFIKDTIRYSKNYKKWRLLDNGPLRTSFQLFFDTWDTGGIKVNAIKTISLDAGSQLNRIENIFSFEGNNPLGAVIGIVLRPEKGIITLDEHNGRMGYWEPTHGNDGTTGIGIIFPSTVKRMFTTNEHILAQTTVENNLSFVYYTGAVWDKAGKITNSNQWNSYLENFQKQIQNPLIVNVMPISINK